MAAMVAAADMVAAVAPPAAALEASMSAALEVFVASAAVVVAAVAVGGAELAGYGHPRGAGSTLAGPNLHLRVKNLASRRSQSDR